jgi:hypothetical protein
MSRFYVIGCRPSAPDSRPCPRLRTGRFDPRVALVTILDYIPIRKCGDADQSATPTAKVGYSEAPPLVNNLNQI